MGLVTKRRPRAEVLLASGADRHRLDEYLQGCGLGWPMQLPNHPHSFVPWVAGQLAV